MHVFRSWWEAFRLPVLCENPPLGNWFKLLLSDILCEFSPLVWNKSSLGLVAQLALPGNFEQIQVAGAESCKGKLMFQTTLQAVKEVKVLVSSWKQEITSSSWCPGKMFSKWLKSPSVPKVHGSRLGGPSDPGFSFSYGPGAHVLQSRNLIYVAAL